VQSSERQVVATIRGIFSPGFLRTAGWLTLVLLVVGVLTWLFRAAPQSGGFWRRRAARLVVGLLVCRRHPHRRRLWRQDAEDRRRAHRRPRLDDRRARRHRDPHCHDHLRRRLRTQATFSFPEDLRGATVGTVGGSRSASYLGDEQIAFEPYASTEDGLRAVNSGEIQYFVHDAAALRYFSSKLFDGRLAVVSAGARPQRYAFALDEGSELREPINRALLQHINSGSWPDLLARYQASATP
jgi:ABC-type amino acid transport substrate-binding protein